MRNRYVVSYDIVDDRRRDRVFKLLRGWGDHLQYSVFQCDVSPRERHELIAQLVELIHLTEDKVLLADLGPVTGRGRRSITAIGRPHTFPERHAVVV